MRTTGAFRLGSTRAVGRRFVVLAFCLGVGLGTGPGIPAGDLMAQEPPTPAGPDVRGDPADADNAVAGHGDEGGWLSAGPSEAHDLAAGHGNEGGWLSAVVGTTPHRNRIIPGLWAMHPFEPQFPELDATRGFGGLWGHWFGATFVNSYDERTFIAGIERHWLELRRGPFGAGLGYRVGLVTGYDERLMELAGHTPVLPFGGVLLWTQLGPLGLDAYYVYRAITLEVGVVFR